MATLNLLIVVALVVLCHGEEPKNNFVVITETCEGPYCEESMPPEYISIQENLEKEFVPIFKKLGLAQEEVKEEFEDTSHWFDDESNCKFDSLVFNPYTVRKNNSIPMSVVQTSYFKQKLRTTQCVSRDDLNSRTEGDQCFSEITSSGKCRNKYGSVVLFVYDDKTKKIERIPVEFPICCVCSIQS